MYLIHEPVSIFTIPEDIQYKILNECTSKKPIENAYVEVNLRSREWLVSCSHHPNTTLIVVHLHFLGRGIDFYS